MLMFPDLPDIEVEGVEVAEEITLTLRTTSSTTSCPSCGTASSRIQSRYTRTLRDLPTIGRPICLILHVRRFFCKKRTCAQKIFAERLANLCHPHAQRTKRLQEALCQLGLKIGGQAGADIGQELGMSGSRDTILRLVRQSPPSVRPEPRVIGLDDWAWKRSLRYGTLICDLELGFPIDLLPERSVETVSAWLLEHPSIAIVSRDGSAEYASAIKKGAPQAREVSDRWHLVKNLAACVSVQITQSLTQLRRAEQAGVSTPEDQQHFPKRQSHPRTPAEKRTQQARQAERNVRYEQIIALQQQGMTSTEIAVHIGMAPRTVREWLGRGAIPYSGSRKPRAALINPYKAYLRERWLQGCRKGVQLEKELRAKGYKGSSRGIYRYLETLEGSRFSARQSGSASTTGPLNPLLTLSAQQATRLFFRQQKDLKEEERESLRQLRQTSPLLETAYQLVEAFLHMVRSRTGEKLDAWLANVEASHLEAFESFVSGIQKDKDAILAGLTLPWSNGPLEGQVNRLKLIKRSMYGRAHFDLLRLRVLYQSEMSQERKTRRKNRQEQPENRLTKLRTMKNSTNAQHTMFCSNEVA